MLFSVVIPVYNVEKYLKECLESIIPQAKACAEGCEILLIDDGSTDGSGKICDQYKELYPQLIKVFHKKNEGLLLTRRFGFKKTNGEYIINCDSDDKLEVGMISRVKSAIDSCHPDVIRFDYFSFDENENKKRQCFNTLSDKNEKSISKEKLYSEFLKGHNVVSMWGGVFKRECIDLCRDYTPYARISNGEDTLQCLEFYSRANSIYYINEALYGYRSGSGMTSKFDPDYFMEFEKIISLMEEDEYIKNMKDSKCLLSQKAMFCSARAVTQSGYWKDASFKQQLNYIKTVAESDMFLNYLKYLPQIKKTMSLKYYCINKMLGLHMYHFITLALRLKNIM